MKFPFVVQFGLLAQKFSTREEAQKALDKAKMFMKASIYKKAVIKKVA